MDAGSRDWLVSEQLRAEERKILDLLVRHEGVRQTAALALILRWRVEAVRMDLATSSDYSRKGIAWIRATRAAERP